MRGRHVLVVGGGASGALAAAHLLRDASAGFRVTVIDPAPRLGRGLAYGTVSPSHLLNARARSMSAFDDLPDHFATWLGGPDWSDRYVERRLYGQYLESILRPWTTAAGDGRLVHLRDAAVDVLEHAECVRVDLAGGASVVGQAAVLAVGHGLVGESVPPPTALPAGDVLIVGTGLGMVDEALTLLDVGHSGRIIALSRRGLLPQPHGPRGQMQLDAADIPLGTHLSYLTRWIRAEADVAGSWTDFIDALRPHVPAIWANLPLDDRSRFLRHARPWWDTHRHRMAPHVAARIAAACARGQLEVTAGRIVDVEPQERDVRVIWRARGTSAVRERRFARIVDCTGPRRGNLRADRLLETLLRAGTIEMDPLAIGLNVSPTLAVSPVGRGSNANRVFAIGPLTSPNDWETYAVPEIRRQCAILSLAAQGNDEDQQHDWRQLTPFGR